MHGTRALLALDLRVSSKVYRSLMTLTISALAGSLGLSADTLRYYERSGLLPRAERTAAGYRSYGEDAVERLIFIRGAKRMGLRLADIKELLDVRDRGQCPCGHTKDLAERRLAEVEAEIQQLSAVRLQLLGLQRRNQACLDAVAADWSCAVEIRNGGEA
jgi:DNA-binding transcriptional MerR regulator